MEKEKEIKRAGRETGKETARCLGVVTAKLSCTANRVCALRYSHKLIRGRVFKSLYCGVNSKCLVLSRLWLFRIIQPLIIYVMNVVNGVRLLHIDFAVHDSFAGIGPRKRKSK